MAKDLSKKIERLERQLEAARREAATPARAVGIPCPCLNGQPHERAFVILARFWYESCSDVPERSRFDVSVSKHPKGKRRPFSYSWEALASVSFHCRLIANEFAATILREFGEENSGHPGGFTHRFQADETQIASLLAMFRYQARIQGINTACDAARLSDAFRDSLISSDVALVDAQRQIFELLRRRGYDAGPESILRAVGGHG